MHFLTRPVALGQGVVKVGYPQFKSVHCTVQHAVQKIHLAFFQRVVTGDPEGKEAGSTAQYATSL